MSKYMITSIVISNPKDWADESILLPHELIRNAILKMETTLLSDNIDNTDWKLDYFHKWYNDYFYNFVKHHHNIEEEIYFPFLKTKADIPEKVVADHTELINQLDEIKDIYDFDILKEKINKLKTSMFEHLAEEEQFIPEILRNNFTEDEEKEIVNKIIQSLGLKGNKMALPWIIDVMKLWSSKKKIKDLYNNLPCCIKIMYNCDWIYDYKKYNIGLLEAIKKNKPIKKCIC